MNRQVAIVLYVVAMVAIIVGVDILFFKNRFWERLLANVAIVGGVRRVLLQNSSCARDQGAYPFPAMPIAKFGRTSADK